MSDPTHGRLPGGSAIGTSESATSSSSQCPESSSPSCSPACRPDDTGEFADPSLRGGVLFPWHDPDCAEVPWSACRNAVTVGDCDCRNHHGTPYALSYDDERSRASNTGWRPPCASSLASATRWRATSSREPDYLMLVTPHARQPRDGRHPRARGVRRQREGPLTKSPWASGPPSRPSSRRPTASSSPPRRRTDEPSRPRARGRVPACSAPATAPATTRPTSRRRPRSRRREIRWKPPRTAATSTSSPARGLTATLNDGGRGRCAWRQKRSCWLRSRRVPSEYAGRRPPYETQFGMFNIQERATEDWQEGASFALVEEPAEAFPQAVGGDKADYTEPTLFFPRPRRQGRALPARRGAGATAGHGGPDGERPRRDPQSGAARLRLPGRRALRRLRRPEPRRGPPGSNRPAVGPASRASASGTTTSCRGCGSSRGDATRPTSP